MTVYTFWCEYDLGINDMVFKDESKLRKMVSTALSDNCVEETLDQLEEDGLFYVNYQELGE